ncbi:aminoglycoside 3'-phosphotransferase [Streptomyces sp. NPDC060194]|uniref:aminoglycoside 3'-phosphotransferase n=1 Tax=Streptomyces sp. NPDC060194 TaxID=3347069 RepID=UPI003656D491
MSPSQVPVLPLADPSLGAVTEEPVVLGLSGARVVRLRDAGGRPVAYVKLAVAPGLVTDLLHEADRLTVLGRIGLPVPPVLDSGVRDGWTWLLTGVQPGRPASDPWPAAERAGVVALLARAARVLHGFGGIAGARYDRTPAGLLRLARRRVEAGLVDRAWSAAGVQGPPAAVALKECEERAQALGPGPATLVHGDLSLPNVLITPERTFGFVDLARAGRGDPHADLADLVRSLRNDLNPQFGEADVELFLDAYGRDRVEPERLALHDELETFFGPGPAS